MGTAARMGTHQPHGQTQGIPRLAGTELEAWLDRLPGPALVLFDAPWSAACRLELEVLVRLASHFADRVHVVALDAVTCREVSHRYVIGWVPTLILFEAGCEVARWEGARGHGELIREIETVLTRNKAPLVSGRGGTRGSEGSKLGDPGSPRRRKGGSR